MSAALTEEIRELREEIRAIRVLLESGTATDEVLDVAAVCALTKLSASALYQKTMHKKGEPQIPCFKRGKRLFFKRSEIMNWLTTNRISHTANGISQEEMETEAANHRLGLRSGAK